MSSDHEGGLIRSHESVDGAAILDLYSEPYWSGPVPVLSEQEQQAVLEHLYSRGMYLAMGTLPLGDQYKSSLGQLANDEGTIVDELIIDDSQIRTLEYVLKLDSETFADVKEIPGSVFGPYFAGDQYYPEGIAIWRPVEETITGS